MNTLRKANIEMALRSILLPILLLAWIQPASAQGLKIGFVNAPVILQNAPQTAAAGTLLEEEFASRETEIQSMSKRQADLEEQLQRNAATLGEDQRRNLERDILAARRDVTRLQREYREDLNLRRNQELAALQQKLKEVLRAIGEEEGFDLIVSNDSVLFAGARINITKDVLERMTQEFEKSGGQ